MFDTIYEDGFVRTLIIELPNLLDGLGFAKHIDPVFVRRMYQKYGEKIIL